MRHKVTPRSSGCSISFRSVSLPSVPPRSPEVQTRFLVVFGGAYLLPGKENRSILHHAPPVLGADTRVQSAPLGRKGPDSPCRFSSTGVKNPFVPTSLSKSPAAGRFWRTPPDLPLVLRPIWLVHAIKPWFRERRTFLSPRHCKVLEKHTETNENTRGDTHDEKYTGLEKHARSVITSLYRCLLVQSGPVSKGLP